MNTVIDAGQVLIGDKVRVTFQVGDVTISREGVVGSITALASGAFSIRTKGDYSLGPSNDSVIELLERPKPKIELPTGKGAVVKYTVNFDNTRPERTALRDEYGQWKCYNNLGAENDAYSSDEDFATSLGEASFPYAVVFAGVAQ